MILVNRHDVFSLVVVGSSPMVGANCRGNNTSDVLAKGLSRGAIATSLLEGVKADTRTQGFYTSSAPSMKVKAYV